MSIYTHMKIYNYSQTTQTAHTLYLDRLSRPIVSWHAMLRLHVMFFDWHLTATCCIQELSFTTLKNTPILHIKHNIYEFGLFLKILYFLSKVFLNIPEYRFLLIGRVQYLYTIEHVVKNIAYQRFQSISVTLLSLQLLHVNLQFILVQNTHRSHIYHCSNNKWK